MLLPLQKTRVCIAPDPIWLLVGKAVVIAVTFIVRLQSIKRAPGKRIGAQIL